MRQDEKAIVQPPLYNHRKYNEYLYADSGNPWFRDER
jgi:hypothetical protein